MCIGVPMRVMGEGEFQCLCEGSGGQQALVDMRLVGNQSLGTWVLVFRDAAREVLDEERAGQIAAALEGLGLAMSGELDVDEWFADLVGREPQLPEFLKGST